MNDLDDENSFGTSSSAAIEFCDKKEVNMTMTIDFQIFCNIFKFSNPVETAFQMQRVTLMRKP